MRALGKYVLGLVAAVMSSVAAAGTVTYYHNDLAGSPVVATDAAGQVIWRESYRPYGERLANAPASAANDIWFTSRRQDAETGLVYMGARYYDPVIGRFMSRDPVGFDERNVHSFNRYAYANNNPYRYKDPNGMWAEDVALAVPGLVIGAVSLRDNLKSGQYLAASVDALGMIGDGVAAAVPGVPGVFGLSIAASRAGAEAAEGIVKTAAKRIELPRLDATGKIHGDIPSHVPTSAKREQLEELGVDLRKSIETRKIEAQRLGEDGPHRNRIRQEEQFLRQVDRALDRF